MPEAFPLQAALQSASDAELLEYLTAEQEFPALQQEADGVRRLYYGTDVYIRGLIEFTNYCKNNCCLLYTSPSPRDTR